MNDNLIKRLARNLHADLVRGLSSAGSSGHGPTIGADSEKSWKKIMQKNLPKRYQVSSGFVVDHNCAQSREIDIIIHDRQYTPFVFYNEHSKPFIPAESVYAACEVKQTVDKKALLDARDKIASVRCLERTSLPIPHAGGQYLAKIPERIIGLLLARTTGWKNIGSCLNRVPGGDTEGMELDMVCISDCDVFEFMPQEQRLLAASAEQDTILGYFLLRLIAILGEKATVPRVDMMAYARHLVRADVHGNAELVDEHGITCG